ncbi:MAG: 2-hydroxychromene-2-carboxylate isomerase [Acidobacteria bacterium]|nr:2-hydroxychromene-2-carboxylate isomerase [Acidobacteriota bacterium]
MKTVTLHLDFVSPYTYLLLTQCDRFARTHGVEWRIRPVVYGAILDATGLVGPVETDAKRAYTFRDVVRAAHMLNVPLKGPPAHPFRSLGALRLLAAYQDAQVAMPLAQGLASAAWAEGRDLTSTNVLSDVAGHLDLQLDVEDTIAAPDIKLTLRDNTTAALSAGVFGVPTASLEGELFWGHDRLGQLGARLDGSMPPAGGADEQMQRRPRGADRARAKESDQ